MIIWLAFFLEHRPASAMLPTLHLLDFLVCFELATIPIASAKRQLAIYVRLVMYICTLYLHTYVLNKNLCHNHMGE